MKKSFTTQRTALSMAPRISGRGPPSPAGYIVAGLDEVAVSDKGRGEGRFQDTPPTVAAICDRRPLHEQTLTRPCGHPLPSDPGYAGGFAEASGRRGGQHKVEKNDWSQQRPTVEVSPEQHHGGASETRQSPRHHELHYKHDHRPMLPPGRSFL